MTWVYDLVEAFPRVVVTVMYKCSWCFPASLVPALSADDRALRERHRRGRRGKDAVDPDDPGVVPLCPGPPGHPFGTDLAKCRGRIREVASFDSCSSGNTKEIGAFLRHMLARNASGTLAAQTLLLHSSPGDHFVKVRLRAQRTFEPNGHQPADFQQAGRVTLKNDNSVTLT